MNSLLLNINENKKIKKENLIINKFKLKIVIVNQKEN